MHDDGCFLDLLDMSKSYWRLKKQDTPAGFGKDGYCQFAIQMSNMKVIAWICTAIGRTRAVQNGKAECDHREP